jgi:hypothetical protein
MRRTLMIPALAVLLTACPEEEEAWEEIAYVDQGTVCWDASDGVLELSVVVQDCMSSSCSRGFEGSCAASLDGSTLTLTSDIRWENNVTPGAECTADCGIPMATCELTGVVDGSYTLDFDGETYAIDMPSTSGTTGCF